WIEIRIGRLSGSLGVFGSAFPKTLSSFPVSASPPLLPVVEFALLLALGLGFAGSRGGKAHEFLVHLSLFTCGGHGGGHLLFPDRARLGDGLFLGRGGRDEAFHDAQAYFY